jgi:hypothetical protein
MCVWRCNMFVEIGYSSVDMDNGVSNLLQRPRTVSTNAVRGNIGGLSVSMWHCSLWPQHASSAKHAVQASEKGSGRADL